MVECTLHMHVIDCNCPEFRDEIPFKEGRMQDPRNSNLWKKSKNRNFDYKIIILVKNP